MPLVRIVFVDDIGGVNDSTDPDSDNAEYQIEEELPEFSASENSKRREYDGE